MIAEANDENRKIDTSKIMAIGNETNKRKGE